MEYLNTRYDIVDTYQSRLIFETIVYIRII